MEKTGSSLVRENRYTYWTPEEDRLWVVVNENPLNYQSWMVLIDDVEKTHEPNLSKIRHVYKAFLRKFPLCVDHWKNLADHEGRCDNNAALQVYEEAVPVYSVKLWHHYCQFAISIRKEPSYIRRLFERGLELVGTDYCSHLLWDSYIKYEEMQFAWNNVADIYTRLLHHPIQDLDLFFNRFKELAKMKPLAELLCRHDPNLDEVVKYGGVRCLSEEEKLARYISVRQKLYNEAKEYESKIAIFEHSIKRSCYEPKHVEDLEAGNWHDYLDFVESEDPMKVSAATWISSLSILIFWCYILLFQVIKLYERCLIPCAPRADIWMRYIEFLEDRKMLEEASGALCRALCHVEKPAQFDIRLFSAKYKERVGDVFGAREQYHEIYSEICPGSHEALEAHANMERRLGNNECACSVYEAAIAAVRQKSDPLALPGLLVQYAQFTYFVLEDLHRSREILSGLCGLKLTKPVIKDVINLESIFPGRRCIEFLDSLVQKFLIPDSTDGLIPSKTEKIEISLLYLEFLDTFGDTRSINAATKRHRSLLDKSGDIFSIKRTQSANNYATLKKQREDVAKESTTLLQFLMENNVIEDFEIHVGPLKGRRVTKTTIIGSCLLRAIYRCFRKHHERMVSWFGDFDANDIMVTYGSVSPSRLICSFKKQAAEAPTFNCVTLDYKNIETILSPYFISLSTGRRPAYLTSLFTFATDPPSNVLSHELSKDLFLRQISVNPALSSAWSRMELYRELQLFLKDECTGSHHCFNNYFPLKGFISQQLASIIASDELLIALYNHGAMVLENPGKLVGEKVQGRPERLGDFDAAKIVAFFGQLDFHADDLLKTSTNIDKSEEICHIIDFYCEPFVSALTGDLCRVTHMHARLKDIYDTFSEAG